MNYYLRFLIRLLLTFFPISFFSFIFTPLTLYASYLLLFFYHPLLEGTNLVINGLYFEFVQACIAVYAYYFLLVLCLWTKDISLKKRLKLIVFGFLIIFVINVLRIAFVIFLAVNYDFYWFNLVHLIFWKFVQRIFYKS